MLASYTPPGHLTAHRWHVKYKPQTLIVSSQRPLLRCSHPHAILYNRVYGAFKASHRDFPNRLAPLFVRPTENFPSHAILLSNEARRELQMFSVGEGLLLEIDVDALVNGPSVCVCVCVCVFHR